MAYRGTIEASSVAVARECEQERARVEDQLRKLTDLALQGLVDHDDLVARRASLVERRVALAGAADPAAELDAWDASVASVLDAGQTLAEAFRQGTQDERRALLGRAYENLVVANRKKRAGGAFPVQPARRTRAPRRRCSRA